MTRTTMREPEPGSVVLAHGSTAWQRFHGDGLWHRADHAGAYEWDTVAAERPIVVYEAPGALDTEEHEDDE